jgi:hypothetical protein
MVIFGLGYGLSRLARTPWLRDKTIHTSASAAESAWSKSASPSRGCFKHWRISIDTRQPSARGSKLLIVDAFPTAPGP